MALWFFNKVVWFTLAAIFIEGILLPALSYEHIQKFSKYFEVRRDLGNRASPVNRTHVKSP